MKSVVKTAPITANSMIHVEADWFSATVARAATQLLWLVDVFSKKQKSRHHRTDPIRVTVVHNSQLNVTCPEAKVATLQGWEEPCGFSSAEALSLMADQQPRQTQHFGLFTNTVSNLH